MTDRLSRERRSWNMSRIRSRDTQPEKQVRSALHRAGYRFRLRSKKLPGSPDVVLPKYHTAVFVHGCFWHRHPGCRFSTTPATNESFWKKKFDANRDRDKRNKRALRMMGWRVFVIWECQTARLRCLERLRDQIRHGMSTRPSSRLSRSARTRTQAARPRS